MSCMSKIPDRVKRVKLTAGKDTVIDTMGLGCILKPSESDVFVRGKSEESKEDAFIVRKGETFEFSSRIVIFASEETNVYCMFYTTL